MDSNLKATIIACLFTLFLSVAAAFGILKTDDITVKNRVEALQMLHSNDVSSLDKRISHERFYLTEKMKQQADATDKMIGRLNIAVDKFVGRAEYFSNTMARIDERLKNIESHEKEVKEGG